MSNPNGEGTTSHRRARRQTLFDVVTQVHVARGWDRFAETASDGVNDQFDCWEPFSKIAKVIYGAFIFIITLGAAWISGSIFHIMVWKLGPPILNSTVTLNKLGGYMVPNEVTLRRYLTSVEEIPSVDASWIWALYLLLIVPYIYVCVTKLWKVMFKTTEGFQLRLFLIGLVIEGLHTTGICLLVFYVLPNFDPTSASVLTFSTTFVPTVLNVIFPGGYTESNNQSDQTLEHRERSRLIYRILSIACLPLLLTHIAFVCVYIVMNVGEEDSKAGTLVIVYLLSSISISFTWLECFLTSNIDRVMNSTVSPGNDVSRSGGLLKALKDYSTRGKAIETFWLYLLKIIVSFIIVIAITVGKADDSQKAFNVLFYRDSSVKMHTLIGTYNLTADASITFDCLNGDPFIMASISILLSWICFKGAQYACKVVLQQMCFALPILLNLLLLPCSFIFMMTYPGTFTAQDCNVLQILWKTENSQSAAERIWPLVVAGLLGYSAIILLSVHVWKSGGIKLEKASRLFSKTSHCGALLDLSLLLTRRRSDKEVIERREEETKQDVYLPMIYMCATMWHETENEMTQLLKSIFRVDRDHFERYRNQQRRQTTDPKYHDPDFYDFEAHIFFDDAFEARPNGRKGKNVNSYVDLLKKCVNLTSRKMYDGYAVEPPTWYKTPYGARIEWNLLGDGANYQNKLIAHLKDKVRIRHRKRWSQIMYMYYILGYELNLKTDDIKCRQGLDEEQKREMIKKLAQNTFILALDGDVDFKPEAVTLLVDRMKKDDLVGASCGRIHPIGSGPMVWYQKFEYAISHWLQKSTEHVIGCVLCSPGCFSLFRGSALMDDNVMKTYTKVPTEAKDHIQWDQGEDRWLCTLMLKQGYKVEYCAASDALTYAPEGFNEFYKQRRRWAPSTMANVLDILLDYRNVVKKNENISTLYIMYQILLFVSSILTPGTIFLLILGAMITAFPVIPPWLALVVNLVPICLLIFSYFISTDDTQLFWSGALSTVYSLVQIVVFIGLIKQGIESQLCSVTTIFFCSVAGIFVFSALFHPKEFTCLFHGILYFLAVPSMSMLLVLYSLCNLHVVSWGTRENKSVQIANSPEVNTGTQEPRNSQERSCSFGTLFKCLFCPDRVHPAPIVQTVQHSPDAGQNGRNTGNSRRQQTTEPLNEGTSTNQAAQPNTSGRNTGNRRQQTTEPLNEGTATNQAVQPSTSGRTTGNSRRQQTATLSRQTGNKRPQQAAGAPNVETTPKEVDQPKTTEINETLPQNRRHGIFRECVDITQEETEFWKDVIRRYLKPLESNPAREKAVQEELLELRNKVFFFLCIINALFVTIIYTLTQVGSYQGTLSINLPCSESSGKQGTIEPISISFTLVFGILLLIQFLGMVYHRLSTLLHIMSAIKIFPERMLVQNMKEERRQVNVRIFANRWRGRAGTHLRQLQGENVEEPGSLSAFAESKRTSAANRVNNPSTSRPMSAVSTRNVISVRQGRVTVSGEGSNQSNGGQSLTPVQTLNLSDSD